ncbi:MAG: hypothetical protein JXC32_20210, partial [Anaerolineae bacterium]|nr:hypothetical protein [Anaerolineae bacterium]
MEGSFVWAEGDSAIDPETLRFTPDQPLPRNAVAQVTIDRSARARAGTDHRSSQATLAEPFSWLFWTVRDPGILDTYPQDGDEDVEVHSDVEIYFASPMQREMLLDYLTIIPAPTQVYSYWHNADTELRLSFATQPATDYRVELSADYPDRYGALLGESLLLRYTTGDLSPYASLSTLGSIGTFNAYTDTVIYARHRNVTRLDLALYELPLETFMRLHGYGSYTYRRDFRPSGTTLVREWSVPVDGDRNTTYLRRIDMVEANGEQLPPGVYYLELTAPEVVQRYPDDDPDSTTFVRSTVNLVLKQSSTESMVWATDLDSGAPLLGLDVRFFAGERTEYGAGTTDDDGLWMAEVPEDAGTDHRVDLWDDAFAFTGEPGDADFAVAFNQWDNGIGPWDFDLASDYGNSRYMGYLYTDRPIYRPGQTVYFKGIVREDNDADYAIPADIAVLDVVVSDPQGKELYAEALPLSEMGTFFDELTLGGEAPLGWYYIQVQGEQWDFYASTSFRVAEYRAPEFEVTVETDRDAYLNGQSINVTVQANYYFGGPVANAPLQWNLLSSPHAFQYTCPAGEVCPRYSWTDYELEEDYGESYGSFGRLIGEGTMTTDGGGRATFRVPADIAEEISSRRFTIEANITDINDQVVSQRTTVVVHKGEFYIGLAPERRVARAGRAQEINLLTVDWDSAAVQGVDVEVVVMEHRWYSVRQETEDGYTYWTWTTEDIPVYTTTTTTDAEGMATIAFTPESTGSYRIRATAEDDAGTNHRRGNEIRSSTYLWVWGGGETVWRRESTNRIDLVADRDSYEVGDTAEILVASPYSGTVQALITIERGHILETEVRELAGSTELLRIPIEAAHIPNVFVSVVLIQGAAEASGFGAAGAVDLSSLASFKMGQAMLPVSTESKQLQITLTPDQEMEEGGFYRPRETAVYDVLVTDSEGKPV